MVSSTHVDRAIFRLISLILIPCTLVDPVSASGLCAGFLTSTAHLIQTSLISRFKEEAIPATSGVVPRSTKNLNEASTLRVTGATIAASLPPVLDMESRLDVFQHEVADRAIAARRKRSRVEIEINSERIITERQILYWEDNHLPNLTQANAWAAALGILVFELLTGRPSPKGLKEISPKQLYENMLAVAETKKLSRKQWAANAGLKNDGPLTTILGRMKNNDPEPHLGTWFKLLEGLQTPWEDIFTWHLRSPTTDNAADQPRAGGEPQGRPAAREVKLWKTKKEYEDARKANIRATQKVRKISRTLDLLHFAYAAALLTASSVLPPANAEHSLNKIEKLLDEAASAMNKARKDLRAIEKRTDKAHAAWVRKLKRHAKATPLIVALFMGVSSILTGRQPATDLKAFRRAA